MSLFLVFLLGCGATAPGDTGPLVVEDDLGPHRATVKAAAELTAAFETSGLRAYQVQFGSIEITVIDHSYD